MPLSQLITRPCFLLLRTEVGKDAYGDPIMDDVSIGTVCEAQPRSSVEPQGNFSSEAWVGFFLPGQAELLNSAGAVSIPGLGSFEVDGRPWMRRNPRTGASVYLRANLKRTAGPEEPFS